MVVSDCDRRSTARPRRRFAELYRETVRDVYAYVATLVGDRAAAEDVVAQAYERAYRKRRSFDAAPRHRSGPGCSGSRATPRWTSCAGASAPSRWSPSRASSPADDDPDAIARRATVRAALGRLEPRDRELIALKYHGGLTNAEIAKLLGVSESNAGTRLHRAMTKLREACDA